MGIGRFAVVCSVLVRSSLAAPTAQAGRDHDRTTGPVPMPPRFQNHRHFAFGLAVPRCSFELDKLTPEGWVPPARR
jgi:hypothetical protein